MKYLILLMAALGVFSSCKKIKQPVEKKDYAFDLLNQRRYDEAIESFAEILKENPDDDEAKYYLASAYAGLAGINVIDSWSAFEVVFVADKTTSRDSELVVPGETTETNSALTEEQRIAKIEKEVRAFLTEILNGSSVLFKMPYANKEERRLLVESIMLLREIDGNSEVFLKAKTYSIFLNLVQFLNFLRDAFPVLLPQAKDPSFGQMLCALDAKIFFENVETMTNYLAQALQDVDSIKELSSRQISPKLADLKTKTQEIQKSYNGDKALLETTSLVFASLKNELCP